MDAPRDLILPPDLAQAVRDRATEQGYSDELDVIRDGLAATSHDVHEFSQEEVEAIRREYAAWQAGTLETVSMEEVRAKFEAERTEQR